MKEVVDELEVKEGKESPDVQKWVDRTIQEIVDDENNFEDKERTEKWVREVVKELLEDERKEDPAPEEPSEPTEPSQPWEIRSKDDLDESLERHPELPTKKNFDKLHEDAVDYLESDNKDEHETPELVKELEYRDLKRAYETVHGGSPEVSIESMKDVDDLLEKYPEERDRQRFEEQYRRSEVHFEIKDNHSMKRDDLAEKHNVGHGFVSDSWSDIEPTQIKRLRGFEEDRIVSEWAENNPEIDAKTIHEFHSIEDFHTIETRERHDAIHHIDTQIVREAVESLKESKAPSTEEVVSAIEHMYKTTPDENHRIHCAELKPELDRTQITRLEKQLHENREDIEKSLTNNLGLEENRVRVAVVEDRMYTWIPKVRSDELVKAYEDQFYYFKDNKEVVRVVNELRKQLKVEGSLHDSLKHMNEVVKQLMEGDEGTPARKRPISETSSRLEGKVVRFYLDATDRKLSDLEGRVVKITGINGQAGIDNPRFPEGGELEVLKARLASIIASDCHLRESGRITYSEEHLERIDRVQDIVRTLGDIRLERRIHKGVYEVHIQNQIGLMMIQDGMTPGNKTIHNPGLPNGFSDWSESAKRAYLEELIPEDGCFDSRGVFSWSRNHALYIDKQNEDYQFESKIGLDEVRLVKDKGVSDDGLVPQSGLSFGELKRLQSDDNPAISKAAKNLVRAVLESTDHLIEDEKKIAESLGMEISLSPSVVKYFKRTGRVIVKWVATTTSKEDALRWAEICPPNDVRKRDAVEAWQRTVAEKWIDKNPWDDL